MSIDFVASHAHDIQGEAVVGTDSNSFDSALNSSSIAILAGYGNVDSPLSMDFEPTTESRWLHFMLYHNSQFLENNSNSDGHWLSFYNDAGGLLARIDMNNGSYYLMVFGDSVVQSAENFSPRQSYRDTYDIHLQVDGAGVLFEVFRNGALIASANAANTAGKTQAVRCVLEHNDMIGANNEVYRWLYYSEIIASSGDSTIGMRVATITPSGSGDHTGWAGPIGNLTDGDRTTGITSDTPGERRSWSNGAYSGPTITNIRAVSVNALTYRGDTGPQNVSVSLRFGSTDYDSAAMPADGLPRQGVWEVNPDTGLPWAQADLSTFESGILSVA